MIVILFISSILIYLEQFQWSESADINATDTSLQSKEVSLHLTDEMSQSTALSVTRAIRYARVTRPLRTTPEPLRPIGKWLNLGDLKANYFGVPRRFKDGWLDRIGIGLNKKATTRRNPNLRSQRKDRWSKSTAVSVTYFSRRFTWRFTGTTKIPYYTIVSINGVPKVKKNSKSVYLFDFSNKKCDISQWYHPKDAVRELDQSKAFFTLHRRLNHQQAILFTLLRPFKTVGFAGVETETRFDLRNFTTILICARAMGNCYGE